MGFRLTTIHGIWAALVVASLALGGISALLLQKESERIRAISDRLLEDRETAIRESMHILFSEIESGLMDSLISFPEEKLDANLEQWARANPFVHTAFYWPAGGALQPHPEIQIAKRRELEVYLRRRERELASSAEAEEDSVAEGRTYDSREFSVRSPSPAPDDATPFVATRQRVREVTKEAYFEQRALEETSRREAMPAAEEAFTALAGSPVADYEAAPEKPAAAAAPRLPVAIRTTAPVRDWGWVEVQGVRVLMGWIRPFAGAALRGFSVDQLALLEALKQSLPDGTDGTAARLIQHQGELTPLQADGALVRPLPESLYPGLALVLPRSGNDVFNRTFWLLAALLIGVLVFTFFFGASLLLWMARRTAVDAMRKTDFLSNVSHELKTPLTTLRMYAEMLEEGRVAPGEAQKRYLRTIHGETRRLDRLVNNVLHFSALQKGKSRLQRRSLDVAALAEEVCGQLAVRAPESGTTLRCEIPREPVMVGADSDALEQCLINLIDNAFKYGEGGEAVVCHVSGDGDGVCLVVEDQGPGVPRDQRHRIFEAFHRVDDSLTTRQPGSGLGLSITQSLVEQMGGTIHCEANRPRGARFIIKFPPFGKTEVEGESVIRDIPGKGSNEA